jgi:hypothetical protein
MEISGSAISEILGFIIRPIRWRWLPNFHEYAKISVIQDRFAWEMHEIKERKNLKMSGKAVVPLILDAILALARSALRLFGGQVPEKGPNVGVEAGADAICFPVHKDWRATWAPKGRISSATSDAGSGGGTFRPGP